MLLSDTVLILTCLVGRVGRGRPGAGQAGAMDITLAYYTAMLQTFLVLFSYSAHIVSVTEITHGVSLYIDPQVPSFSWRVHRRN